MTSSSGYGGDPFLNAGDAVRLLIGDTDTADELLSDAEVGYFLSISSNTLYAASLAANAVAAKFARQIDSEVDEIRALASQRYQQYTKLSAALLERAGADSSGSFSVVPSAIYAGGLSISGKRTERADTDRVPPRFDRDMHTHPDGPNYRDDDQDVADFGSS